MEPSEWTEIISWVDDRFPRGWTPDQAVAYFDDLKHYTAEDVWDALYRIYDRGIKFAPNGSEMKAEATEVVRFRMRRAREELQGIGSGTDGGTWKEWHRTLGFPEDLGEAIRVRHLELFPTGCAYSECDACGNVLV